MKKHVTATLAAALALMLALSACSAGSTGGSQPSSQPPEESKAAQEQQDTREWWQLAGADWDEHTAALDTGINMTYLTCGPEDGTPVVLIHGATDSRLSWAQVAPALAAQGFRVYVPELRGHGKTDKPADADGMYTVAEHTADILSFLDKAGVESANIVGHSLGSLISQELAEAAPEKVRTITLIASGAKSAGNEALDWVFDGDGAEYLGVHGYDDTKTLPADFVAEWAACTNEDADFCRGIYLHAEGLPYEVWGYIFGGLKVYDNTDGLASITCPVQIIWGTQDSIFLESDQTELQSGLTNAEKVSFVSIEGASHNTHWDSKEIAAQVSGLIAGFAVK